MSTTAIGQHRKFPVDRNRRLGRANWACNTRAGHRVDFQRLSACRIRWPGTNPFAVGPQPHRSELGPDPVCRRRGARVLKPTHLTFRRAIDSQRHLECAGSRPRRAQFVAWFRSAVSATTSPASCLGFCTPARAVLTSGSIKLGANWVIQPRPLRHRRRKFRQTPLGLGYSTIALFSRFNYVTSYRKRNVTPDHRVIMQIGLRTLGSTGISQTTNPTQ